MIIGVRNSYHGIGTVLLGAALLAGLVTATPSAVAAQAPGTRVHLKVLVLSDGSPGVSAIAAQLDSEGVPTRTIDLRDAGRPVIDRSFLADDTSREAHFQAVVLPYDPAVTSGEMAALTSFERDYGIREVVTSAIPGAAYGMTAAVFSGTLDGGSAAVTADGSRAGFGYLDGPLQIDDVDAGVSEMYGHLASGADSSYTPLIEATHGGSTGSIVGVYAAGGLDRMVITVALGVFQRFFLEIAHGIVTWLTRGIHLGYQRNYFSVHVDDVFMAGGQWSPEGRCTPGDDCYGDAADIVTDDIRMVPADVTHAVAWQQGSGVTLDMVFNGGGSDEYLATTGAPTDPLVAAFAENAGSFGWINHTYTHSYLGCIQVAPPQVGQQWHCATAADMSDQSTVFIEPELAASGPTYDDTTGLYFASGDVIEDQIGKNRLWAGQHGIPIDSAEVVTGEHSGLAIQPMQPIDNPNLAPALTAEGITALASDASREPDSRSAGPALTVPRHPMNIFYNVSTYYGEVTEYNWYYTSSADGGSGTCDANPSVTTCVTPLPAADDASARGSFTTYILPLEVRHALSFILSNDPRPFFIHQANLTGERIVYPVLDGIVDGYDAAYNTSSTPLVQLTMTKQAETLARTADWQSSMAGVDAYLDESGVHVLGGGSVAIPVTMPAGASVTGMSVESYGGEQSGWIAAGQAAGVAISLTDPLGGYIGVPAAPTITDVSAAHQSATVTWAPGDDHGSPITGFTVRGYIGANVTATTTMSVAADAVSATVTDLVDYYPYSFTVTADSAAGSSDESARSATVIPAPAPPGAPVLIGATAGDGTATLTWAPLEGGDAPVTVYTARLYLAGSGDLVGSLDVAPSGSAATFTGLTNGVGYEMDVFANNASGPGPASLRSAVVTPQAPVPTSTGTTTTTATTIPSTPVTTTSTATTIPSPPPVTSTTVTSTGTTSSPPPVTSTTVTPPGPGEPTSTTTPPSSAASSTPPAVPGPPRVRLVIPGNKSLTVHWAAPRQGDIVVSRYIIRIYQPGVSEPVRTVSADGAQTSRRVGNLVNGVTYRVSVQAVGVAGPGQVSDRSTGVTPKGKAPGKVRIDAVHSGKKAGQQTAVVEWSAPAKDGGAAITKYIVTVRRLSAEGEWRAAKKIHVRDPALTTTQLTLRPGTYSFTVRAVNPYGKGKVSRASDRVMV